MSNQTFKPTVIRNISTSTSIEKIFYCLRHIYKSYIERKGIVVSA